MSIYTLIMADQKVEFSSTFSTFVTLLGYSLSNSDFWRFPFLIYRNGGGAFLIPYLLTIALCGIPLYYLEYSIAKFSGKGPYAVWDICPLFRGSAVTIVIAYLIFIIGSTIFRCWMIEFFLNSFQSPLPWATCNNEWNTPGCINHSLSGVSLNSSTRIANITDANMSMTSTNFMEFGDAPFNYTNNTLAEALGANFTYTRMSSAEEFWQYRILELSSGVTDLYPVQWRYILIMLLFRVAIFLGVFKSIKSIEKIWIEAFLMGFYTLAFGWGCILTLGSHAAFKENSLRASILLPILDTFSAMFTGIVAFSVLGNMAAAYGVETTEVINAGMSVGIVSYMTALTSLPFPQLWTVMFLLALLLASLDTQLVPFEMIVQTIGDMFPSIYPKYRTHILAGLSIFVFVAALPTCTGAGAYLFLWSDWYTGAWTGPCVSIIELVVFCWIYGIDRLSYDFSLMNGRAISPLMRALLGFVAPVAVLLIFLTSIAKFVPPSYGDYVYPYAAQALGWVLVLFALFPVFYKSVVLLRSERGTILQKLKNVLKPNDGWGSRNEESHSECIRSSTKFSKRSYKDLLHYNVFGRYRRTNGISRERTQEVELL